MCFRPMMIRADPSKSAMGSLTHRDNMRRDSIVLPCILVFTLIGSILSPLLYIIGENLVFAIWAQPVEGRVVASHYVEAVTACSAGRGRHPAYQFFDYRFVDTAGAPQHISERLLADGPCPSVGDAVQIEYLPAFGGAARHHDHNPAEALTRIFVPIAIIAVAYFVLVKRQERRPRVFVGLASEDGSR
jgi:hypothetical protein